MILLGDCVERMKELPDNSIDAVVTDPPYELGFMGKKWDGTGIAYSVEMWSEVLRVLKPGGHLLAFGGTRTYHRMACAIEDAGFEIRDQIQYLYGSGFPKSYNIEKGMRKYYDKQTEQNTEHDMRPVRKPDISQTINHEDKQGEVLQSVMSEQSIPAKESQTADNVRGGQSIVERGSDVFQEARQLQTDKVCEVSKGISTDGSQGRLCDGTQTDNGKDDRQTVEACGSGTSHQSRPARQSPRELATISHEQIAQDIRRYKGFGSALKPANEQICLARKPLSEKTIVENVLKWGTGGMNIDGCRVETKPRKTGTKPTSDEPCGTGNTLMGSSKNRQAEYDKENKGRFPANLILDEEAGRMLDEQSGVRKSGAMSKEHNVGITGEDGNMPNHGIYGKYKARPFPREVEASKGGASRFFYTAKASRKERNAGLEGIEEHQTPGVLKMRVDGSLDGVAKSPRQNHHPTVKPISLMRYLCRLITPPNGTVLDPFMGSGTTGCACVQEGFDFVGIEQDAEYIEIAQKRIEYWNNSISVELQPSLLEV